MILGQVLEKAAGRPLDALIREGILDPLALAGTRSEATAVISEPVLHGFDAEHGRYEESTFWDPSWTLASGAIMTSNVADILASAAAIGQGALLWPESHALQLAPTTAKFPPWSDTTYYGFGGLRHRRLDRAEPVLRRLRRDDGLAAVARARHRGLRHAW